MNFRNWFFGFIFFSILPAFGSGGLSDPDFLIIGCMKSGTTQLTYFLSQHPNIGCFCKEVHFFDRDFEKGRAWYQTRLPRKNGNVLVTGEDSPNYICDERVPARVFAMYPNIKLILILRNPVDRSYSHYHMRVRNKWEPLSFEEAITIEQRKDRFQIKYRTPPTYPYLETSMYVTHLKRWLSFFSPGQMLIIFNEELKSDPMNTLNRVCEFLGVSPFRTMPDEDPVLIRKYPPMNQETRHRLEELFAPYNEELEMLIGKPVPW